MTQRENSRPKTALFGSAMFNWSETQRMIEIAGQLHKRGWRVVFLGEGRFDRLLEGLPFLRERLEEDRDWYTPDRIAKMLDMEKYGNRYATPQEIDRVVCAELRLVEKYQPDVIVTGYRMTLTLTARIAKVKLAWCLSATVSKLYLEADTAQGVAALEHLTKAELKSMPYPQVRSLYADKLMRDRAVKSCTTSQAWNEVLRLHGCAPLTDDMELFEGDINLMSDARELFPELPCDDSHAFIGPIFNSEKIPIAPEIAETLSQPGKKVLISVGSGGKKENLIAALEAARAADAQVFVSTIGSMTEAEMADYPSSFHFAEKFPLVEVARRCDAAVIQAGQGTLYAVLLAGCPFVSLPATFEQRHNVRNLVSCFPCGEIVYPYEVSAALIARNLQAVLTEPRYREAAVQAKSVMEDYVAHPAEETAAELLEAAV
ncbi:MAG: hypothetical protein PUF80_05745 [Firmicutes bacterium]|nr:hypothetical protein [Bacillota bacterium]